MRKAERGHDQQEPAEQRSRRTRPRRRLVLTVVGTIGAVGVMLVLAVAFALLFQQSLQPEGAGRETSAATPNLPGPWVAELLRSQPAPGETVEVDAYFSGSSEVPFPGMPPGMPDNVFCPTNWPWAASLTDLPFRPMLQVLNGTSGNLLPEAESWLVATVPDAREPGQMIIPELPYLARFRGHLGDPAFAHCPHAGRILVVEAVVAVYQQEPQDSNSEAWQLPEGYGSWPRYHSAEFGYSLPHPVDWQVEQAGIVTAAPGLLLNTALRAPRWPHFPVTVQVYAGETRYDQYDPSSIPALLNGQSFGVYEQGWAFGELTGSQHLAGFAVNRKEGSGPRSIAALFSAHGYTYELALTYPTGFDASQELLTAYTAMVEGFRLDTSPGPTPSPPINEALGTGPFLSQDEALALVRLRDGQDVELLAAALIPEGEARRQADACSTFFGHPEGVWLLTVRGTYEGIQRTMAFYVDATNGEPLCGEEIAPDAPPEPADPAPLPPATAAPATSTPAVTAGAVDETWLDTSPDGQWVAQGMAQYPADGQTYYTRFFVSRVDGSATWMLVDEWAPMGLGYTTPRVLHWSEDGRSLYWTHRPVPDGCALFVNGTDLQRLDLGDGTVTNVVPEVGLWLSVSPDEDTLAYIGYGGRGLVLRDLATGGERQITLPLLAPEPQWGAIAWSPDALALVLTGVTGPCGPTDARRHSIVRVDVADEIDVTVLLDADARRFVTVDWPAPNLTLLRDKDGRQWWLDSATGELSQQ